MIKTLDIASIELIPAVQYTKEDLDFENHDSRGYQEQMNPVYPKPELSYAIFEFAQYSHVILIFPLWMKIAPMLIRTFLNRYDFSSKTIFPLFVSDEVSEYPIEKNKKEEDIISIPGKTCKWKRPFKNLKTTVSDEIINELCNTITNSICNDYPKHENYARNLITYFSIKDDTIDKFSSFLYTLTDVHCIKLFLLYHILQMI